MLRCNPDSDGRCAAHGGVYDRTTAGCQTTAVLLDVRDERARQFHRYGSNEDILDGTGPFAEWAQPISGLGAYELEAQFRDDYNQQEKPTWVQLVREEVAEAFLEDDPERLREELIQVAALAVSWIEKLDNR